ncbi:uncharacterized protein LOC143564726 [Bidens hawaiensis]|uniref:uncharacterized protein LOC143564726 n=1 Tax=Bidens hawaiensis TaxID=980011 RepID=UPI0040493809
MYQQCFDHLDEEDKTRLEPVNAPVSGFSNEITHPFGQLKFPITLNDVKHSRIKDVEFLVLPMTSKHDINLGRETIDDFNANSSTTHDIMGVFAPTGITLIRPNKDCLVAEVSKPLKAPKLADNSEPEKWSGDMVGVSRYIAEHTLKVNPTFTAVVQKRQNMGLEHTKAMYDQVPELLIAGTIREIRYQTWVANPFMIPKSKGACQNVH